MDTLFQLAGSYALPGIFTVGGVVCLFPIFLGRHVQVCRRIAVGLALLTFLYFCILFYGFTIDDTFISLRYARNFARGAGIVFNTVAERPVEGYTNFLWVVMETPLFLLGLSDSAILHGVKILGILFGLGSMIAVKRLGDHVGLSPASGPAAALIACSIPYFAFWSVGGLETSAYVFFSLAAVSRFLSECNGGKKHIGAYALLLGMALTRPEGLFFTAAMLPAMMAFEALGCRTQGFGILGSLRRSHSGLVCFALFYGAYFAWRWNFYGYPFPNTFYAKSGSISVAQIVFRLTEMAPLLRYLVPLLMGFLIVQPFMLTSRSPQRVFVFFAFCTLFGLSLASRREWMPGFRYVVPSIPFFVAVAAASLDAVPQSTNAKIQKWVAMQSVSILLVICCLHLVPAHACREMKGYARQLDKCHVAFGRWLRLHAPTEASFAGWDMGAIPYFSQLPSAIDIHPEGLLDSHTTHAGYDPARFLALEPSFLVLPQKRVADDRPARGIQAFYVDPRLSEHYRHLFTLTFRADYLLEVYARNTVPLSSEAMLEGQRIARTSAESAHQNH